MTIDFNKLADKVAEKVKCKIEQLSDEELDALIEKRKIKNSTKQNNSEYECEVVKET